MERWSIESERQFSVPEVRTYYIYKREKIEQREEENTGSFVTSLGKNLVDSGEKQGAM